MPRRPKTYEERRDAITHELFLGIITPAEAAAAMERLDFDHRIEAEREAFERRLAESERR